MIADKTAMAKALFLHRHEQFRTMLPQPIWYGLLTVPEAAAHLGLKRRQVQVYCASGRLPALRLASGAFLIDRTDLEAFRTLPRPKGGYKARKVKG